MMINEALQSFPQLKALIERVKCVAEFVHCFIFIEGIVFHITVHIDWLERFERVDYDLTVSYKGLKRSGKNFPAISRPFVVRDDRVPRGQKCI